MMQIGKKFSFIIIISLQKIGHRSLDFFCHIQLEAKDFTTFFIKVF